MQQCKAPHDAADVCAQESSIQSRCSRLRRSLRRPSACCARCRSTAARLGAFRAAAAVARARPRLQVTFAMRRPHLGCQLKHCTSNEPGLFAACLKRASHRWRSQVVAGEKVVRAKQSESLMCNLKDHSSSHYIHAMHARQVLPSQRPAAASWRTSASSRQRTWPRSAPLSPHAPRPAPALAARLRSSPPSLVLLGQQCRPTLGPPKCMLTLP